MLMLAGRRLKKNLVGTYFYVINILYSFRFYNTLCSLTVRRYDELNKISEQIFAKSETIARKAERKLQNMNSKVLGRLITK